MSIASVTSATFKPVVLDAARPVLVDFWADWCGPCRALAPALELAAGALAGQVDVVKVNIDEQPELAERYAIASIPTLLLIRDGQVIHEMRGAQSRPALLAGVRAALD